MTSSIRDGWAQIPEAVIAEESLHARMSKSKYTQQPIGTPLTDETSIPASTSSKPSFQRVSESNPELVPANWYTGRKLNADEDGFKDKSLSIDQRYVAYSQLIGPIIITFNEKSELFRAKSKILPESFWRTFHETSITLSSYVSKETHIKHREQPHLKIDDQNAFQSVGKFLPQSDLTRERIDRHLSWNKKRHPSSYISTFKNLTEAKKRAKFHYHDSQCVGHRVSIAEIRSHGLVPATLRTSYRTAMELHEKFEGVGFKYQFTKCMTRDVNIPIWVRKTIVPTDQSAITEAQWLESGTDMWLSINELRLSDIQDVMCKYGSRDAIASRNHRCEWLCCGTIPKSLVNSVMPYDGKDLHATPSDIIIRSRASTQPWVFNWENSMWELNHPQYTQAIKSEMEGRQEGDKDSEDMQVIPFEIGRIRGKKNKRARKEQGEKTGLSSGSKRARHGVPRSNNNI
ncbi:hypothetical protein B0J11DRAFT_584954 [Dendryphion nanum]|uniref:Uncharacterized protein n=1 Tax=Dendryphion nanum TaxID=256645 RepID=A0A9P9IAG6_9PLEO|nr:hypothetical protein B0J11DRAFT_584954 [Dendryphion nanum]